MIVVHGTQDTAAPVEAVATKVYDYGPGEAAAADTQIEWFFVRDGEQAGPATAVEVEQYYAAGVIEDETYIWREGMNDWLRFREVPEFGHVAPREELPDEAAEANAFQDGLAGVTFSSEEQAVGDSTTPAVVRGGNGHADLGGFDGGALDYSEDEATQVVALETFNPPSPVSAPVKASPLATMEGTPSAALFSDSDATNPTQTPAAMVADQAPSVGGGGLASAVEPPAPAPEPAFSFDALAQQPAEAQHNPRVTDADDLIGRRSENSVLFSLDLLSGSNEAVDSQPTEGSGLIDIRALAASEAGGPNRPATQSGEAAVVAPAVMPMGRRRSNTGLYIVLGVVCVVIVGLISAILILVMNKGDEIEVADPTANIVAPDDENQVAANVDEPDSAEPGVDPEAVARHERNATMIGTRKAMATQAEAQGAAERIANRPVAVAEVTREANQERTRETTREPEEVRERTQTSDEDRAARQARRERRAREREAAAQEASNAEDPVAAALQRIRPNDGDDDDDREETPPASDDDDEDDENETASVTPPASNVPESLSQSEVSRAIRRYRRRISQCTAELPSGESLRVDVNMTVQGTGRVASARTETSGDVAQCVVAIVRDMSFPEFSGDPMTFTYPFRLRN